MAVRPRHDTAPPRSTPHRNRWIHSARRIRRVLCCGAGLVVVLGVTGCDPNPFEDSPTAATPGEAPRSLSTDQAAACRALIDALPDTLADRKRAEAGWSATTAAWGDPAIRVECGVDAPSGFAPASTCQVVDGVDWYIDDDAMNDPVSPVVATTVTTSPRIQVRVPAALRPPAAAMVDLGPAVKKSLRRTGRCG